MPLFNVYIRTDALTVYEVEADTAKDAATRWEGGEVTWSGDVLEQHGRVDFIEDEAGNKVLS